MHDLSGFYALLETRVHSHGRFSGSIKADSRILENAYQGRFHTKSSGTSWAGIATVAALAAHAYVTQAGFAQELIVQASSDLQALQLIDWRRNSTSWRVECISDYDPY